MAEDNKINKILMTIMFRKLGLRCDVVSNGREAVDAVLRHPRQYDLVVMDLHMPEMDGMEANRRIQSHFVSLGVTPKPKVVALTANVLSEAREQCKVTGFSVVSTRCLRKRAFG